MNKIWVTIYFLLMISISLAQLSPGDLSNAHADLEGLQNCTKCHEIGEKVSPQKCLTCHDVLHDRIRQNRGLHAGKEYQNCVECHSDHHGRKFNLIWWKDGQKNFDHSKTGYTLEGKHLQLDCRKCHRAEYISNPQKYRSRKKNPETTFLGLNPECLSCHHNEHRNQLDQQCLNCHQMNGWKPAPGFDHSFTKYPLTGKHRVTLCESCHIKMIDNSDNGDPDYLKYTGLGFKTCSNCHQDPHAGRLGLSCKKCHTTTGWKGIADPNFNHTNTRFPLLGKHRGVECKKCHNNKRSLKNLKYQQCSHCHRDYHQGQFSHRQQKGACEECHTVQGFQPANFTIQQHEKSGYALNGAHLAVPCNMCHQKTYGTTLRFQFTSTECTVCHSDPHKGEASLYVKSEMSGTDKKKCEFCHSVKSWDLITFDHSRTGFILAGKHKSIRCGSCHQKPDDSIPNPAIKFKIGGKKCQDCHKDIHRGQFIDGGSSGKEVSGFTRCNRCHSPEDWRASGFNHDRDSKFKLEGAHKGVACNKCHKSTVESGENIVIYKPLDTACSACHAQKEVKMGGMKS